MSIGGGAGVDRTIEGEVFADAPRCQVHQFSEHAGQLLFINFAGIVQIDVK